MQDPGQPSLRTSFGLSIAGQLARVAGAGASVAVASALRFLADLAAFVALLGLAALLPSGSSLTALPPCHSHASAALKGSCA